MSRIKTALLRLLELVLAGFDRVTHGGLTKLVKQPGDNGYDDRPSPHPHD